MLLSQGYVDMENVKEIMLEFVEKLEVRYNSNAENFGNLTGIYDYDMLLGGLHKSELTILAGRHSMGKTSFAVGLMNNLVLKRNTPVLFFSYEMNREVIANRIVLMEAEVENTRVYNGQLTPKDWEKVCNTINKLAEKAEKGILNIHSSCTLNYISLFDEIRQFASQHEDGVVIIDYFQLIKLEGKEDRITELSCMAAAFKRLAVELNIPIVLLSQVSKKCEDRTDKRPMLSDLAECDALAQHADNVIFIYRNDYYFKNEDESYSENPKFNKGECEVIIAKQKNGPTGKFKMLFQPGICKFKTPIKTEAF